jgi:hypothetical protein
LISLLQSQVANHFHVVDAELAGSHAFKLESYFLQPSLVGEVYLPNTVVMR